MQRAQAQLAHTMVCPPTTRFAHVRLKSRNSEQQLRSSSTASAHAAGVQPDIGTALVRKDLPERAYDDDGAT